MFGSNNPRFEQVRMLEGVVFGIAQLLDIMKEHQLPLKKIMAEGGGAKNIPWLQIIADISAETLNPARGTMESAFGDALMGALASGCYKIFPSFTVGEKQKRSKYAENTGKKSVYFIQKKYIYQRIMSPIVPKVGISEMDKALRMDEKSSLD